MKTFQSCIKIYHQIREGDLYHNWQSLLRLIRYERSEVTIKETIIQWSIFLFLLFTSFRIGFSCFLPSKGIEHLLGHTLVNAGEAGRIISTAGGILLLETGLMRMIFWRKDGGQQLLLNTIRKLQHAVDHFQDDRSVAKLQLARRVFIINVLAILLYSPCFAFVTAAFAVNAVLSESWFEVLVWTFWWINDLVMECIFVVEFPSGDLIWLFLMTEFRMGMTSFAEDIGSMTNGKAVINTRQLMRRYDRLKLRSRQLAPLFSSLLSVFLVCNILLISILAYEFQTAHGIFKIFSFILCPLIVVQAVFVLSFAGQILSLSRRIHDQLFRLISCNQGLNIGSSVKRDLLHVLEELASDYNPLSLRTTDGQMFTMERFTFFIIEAAIQYTLIVTLASYLQS
jgi:hypothetical protein